MKRTFSAGLLAAIMAGQSAPALAEIVDERDDGFITRHTVTVDASPTETWLALISPSRWWDKQHTWSSDSANLKLTPQAGGCFCETIPEVDEPDRFTLEGSVEHMRVIQAYPEQALRMVGALGPLQSEPVTGVLTIALSEVKRDGETSATKIVWEYNVGGPMRYEVPVISKAVDGVMALQVAGLGTFLGVLENEAPRG
ncbi:MAG: SRPBCC family protein, partial [Pseudomonadota bacterium]